MIKPALNCDLGEGTNNEAQIMPLIYSCSVACGGHAGDHKSMENAILLAMENEVSLGAHPSYPDRKNFGRAPMEIEDEQLILSIQEQLWIFDVLLQKHKAPLHHIKTHGALYNETVKNAERTIVYLKAIDSYKDRCYLYVPYNSVIATLAKKLGFKIKYEAFGDRSYMEDLSLVPRELPGAVIEDKQKVFEQIHSISTRDRVRIRKDYNVTIKADTFCIHSDTANAVVILRYLNEQFRISNFG